MPGSISEFRVWTTTCMHRHLIARILLNVALELNKQTSCIVTPTAYAFAGCTSYTYFGAMDGAFSQTNSCVAQNDRNEGGAISQLLCH